MPSSVEKLGGSLGPNGEREVHEYISNTSNTRLYRLGIENTSMEIKNMQITEPLGKEN